MRILSKKDLTEVVKVLKSGELICSPTDTLFGILGNALSKEAVDRLYSIKKRDPEKPLIVLFDSIERLEEFGITIPVNYSTGFRKLYPASITAILPLSEKSPFREIFKRNNLAIRIPDDEFLRQLIRKTFPLFAPSANPQGETPAKSCEECRRYFEGQINYCIEGESKEVPSTIVDLTGKEPLLVREGAVRFEEILEVLSEAKA